MVMVMPRKIRMADRTIAAILSIWADGVFDSSKSRAEISVIEGVDVGTDGNGDTIEGWLERWERNEEAGGEGGKGLVSVTKGGDDSIGVEVGVEVVGISVGSSRESGMVVGEGGDAGGRGWEVNERRVWLSIIFCSAVFENADGIEGIAGKTTEGAEVVGVGGEETRSEERRVGKER